MTARQIISGFVSGLVAVVLAACGAGDENAERAATGDVTVVATTTQLGDFAREVAGDRAGVRQILAANSDPHDYEPRPSDVEAVSGAAVVLRSGGDLDAWLDGVLRNAASEAQTVTLLDAVRAREGEGQKGDGGSRDAEGHEDASEIDPHWWQDPRNAISAVREIRDALVAADPEGRDAYAAAAQRYVARLRDLDRAIAACMAGVPESKRKLVTDHDALGYYTDRYDIDVIGTVVPARSTQAQASAGEVARLVRTIRAAGVTTIFPQGSGNQKLTRAIARDAGAKVGPALYADSLGAPGTDGETYIGSMKANTRALVNGFTGGRRACRL
ncbi:MAG TPA: metal ABC transporter substrate-binding protein [Solirubrobacteraceae bacterium]|nr:metal ABC transporter substrate-binding protein [Solirubrobacteraceae bacterium]